MPINECGSAPHARFAANAVHELVTTSVAARPLPFAILSFPMLVLEVLVRAHRCLQSHNAARISAHCLPRRACSARHASSSATRSSNVWGGQFQTQPSRPAWDAFSSTFAVRFAMSTCRGPLQLRAQDSEAKSLQACAAAMRARRSPCRECA